MLEKISPEILREKLGLIKWVFLVGFFSNEFEILTSLASYYFCNFFSAGLQIH